MGTDIRSLDSASPDDSLPARKENFNLNALPGDQNNFGDSEDDSGVNILKYFGIIYKHKKLVISLAIISVIIAIVVTSTMTPIYNSMATLQISQDASNITNMEDIQSPGFGGKEYFQTQIELLKSRSLAMTVVKNLNLVDDKNFIPNESPSFLSLIKGKIVSFLGKSTDQPEVVEDRIDKRTEQAAKSLLQNLTITPVRGSLLVRITYSHPDPEMAMRLANGIAETFISENINRRYEASSYARQFLEERIQQLKTRMEKAETQMVAYAREQQIFGTDSQRTLTDDNLASVNAALVRATAERTRLEELWKVADGPEGDSLPQISNNKNLQDSRSQYISLSAEYQQKLKVYKPVYPDMIVLKAKMDELKSQIDKLVENGKGSILKEYEVARNNEAALERQIKALKEEAISMRDRGIQYGFLKREVDTNRTLYDGLLQRYKEISITNGVGTNNIAFVDHALKPGEPSSPNLSFNIGVALAAGLLIGVALSFGLEYLDDTIKIPAEVEGILALPVVGMIPRPKDNVTPEDALGDPWSSISEAYRSLRTALQFSTSTGTPKTMLITSVRPGDGKSTTALALARNFAQIGQKVLLIDADLRYSSLHKKISVSRDTGLSNYLSGQMTPQEAVQPTQYDNLFFMSSGPLPPNPVELLAGSRMASLIGLAANQYSVVIVDAPPVMGLADAPLLASLCEATFLIVASGQTRRDAARVTVKNLKYGRARLFGAVLTKFDVSNVSYGYGGYGYGENYHSYGDRPRIADAAAQGDADKRRNG